jgi:adenylate cyclase
MERRLSAIFAADMVGYSRLMEVDDVGTLQRQKVHRTELIDPKINEFHGRIVKEMGDGVLIEFPSAVEAVQCAVAIQREMAEREADVSEDRRIQYRIGINIGDIIIEGDDIFGDGVNVAARIESLAEPGGLCITRDVHNQIHHKMDLAFKEMGEHSLKNIERTVHIYRAEMDSASDPEERTTPNSQVLLRNTVFAGLAVLALVLFMVVWPVLDRPRSDHTADVIEKQEVPTKLVNRSGTSSDVADVTIPSIAVLPFDNLSNDPDQEYFSDGMTEDLITDLSRISGLFVIARNSSFTYKGKAVNIQDVGRELGVRYILEGSVRKVGDQVRINAQLIDTSSGGHLWAQRYDGKLDNVFALQDKITAEIISALAQRLSPSASGAVVLKPSITQRRETDNVAAYEEFLQGWAFYNRRTPENLVIAVSHFNRALELDLGYARARAALASVYWESWKRFWQRQLGLSENYIAWEKADFHLQQALLSPTPLAYRVSSEMLLINRRFDKAIAEAQSAIELNPNDALGYVVMANAKIFAGEANSAVKLIEKAMRLDPRYPPSYQYSMALAQFSLQHYAEAESYLTQAIERSVGDPLWFVLLIAIYGQLENTEKAEKAIARLDALQRAAGLPRFTIGWPRGRWPYKEKHDRKRLREGLLQGGLPEG